MTVKGHTILASFSLITIGTYNNIPLDTFTIFYSGGIIGALLPDIDEKQSYIGRKLKIISSIISSIFGHRTFTHYLIFPVLIFLCGFYFLEGALKTFVTGLAVGVLLHDLGDMLTKGGIVGFFWPILAKTRIALMPKPLRFYTGSLQEHILIISLLVGNIVMGYIYFTNL